MSPHLRGPTDGCNDAGISRIFTWEGIFTRNGDPPFHQFVPKSIYSSIYPFNFLLPFHLLIYSFHSCIHLSICPSVYFSICPASQPASHLSICSSLQPAIHSICSSINSFSVHASIHPFTCVFIYPSTFPFICSSLYPHIYPSLHPSFFFLK